MDLIESYQISTCTIDTAGPRRDSETRSDAVWLGDREGKVCVGVGV